MAPLAYEYPTRSELLESVRSRDCEVTDLKRQVADLNRQVAKLQAENALLRRELDKGTGRRRKRSRKNSAKRPRRKPGQGVFTNRKPPENPSGPVEQASVENLSYPDCASRLVPDGYEEVTVTYLPEPVKPITTTYRLEVCRPSGEAGAGRRGKPMNGCAGKQSTAPTVHTDDTGWRVAGQPAQMMGFESEEASVYQIRPRHRNEELREVIGDEFEGVLVCDRGKAYDASELKGVKQNKCLAHLQRLVSEVMAKQPPAARTVGLEVRDIFYRALELWRSYGRGELTLDEYRGRGGELLQELKHALRPRRLSEDNALLIDGLHVQMERGHLPLFLEDPSIPPTNNDAERMLRDVVISRKVSQGSKNERGARATEMFRSVLRSAARSVTGDTIPAAQPPLGANQLPENTTQRHPFPSNYSGLVTGTSHTEDACIKGKGITWKAPWPQGQGQNSPMANASVFDVVSGGPNNGYLFVKTTNAKFDVDTNTNRSFTNEQVDKTASDPLN